MSIALKSSRETKCTKNPRSGEKKYLNKSNLVKNAEFFSTRLYIFIETVLKNRKKQVKYGYLGLFFDSFMAKLPENILIFLQNPLDKFICLVYNVSRP